MTHVLTADWCSCALDIAISTMADAGQNILVPRPGFPIYTTLSAGQVCFCLFRNFSILHKKTFNGRQKSFVSTFNCAQ